MTLDEAQAKLAALDMDALRRSLDFYRDVVSGCAKQGIGEDDLRALARGELVLVNAALWRSLSGPSGA